MRKRNDPKVTWPPTHQVLCYMQNGDTCVLNFLLATLARWLSNQWSIGSISFIAGGMVVGNRPASAACARDVRSIPEFKRSPGGGNGNLFQYFGLENSMDRGVSQATVHGVAKSRT